MFGAPASVQEVGARRQAQLLAALSFIFLLGNGTGALANFARSGKPNIVFLAVTLVPLITYLLSRTRYFVIGSWILSWGIWLAAYLLALSAEIPIETIFSFVPLAFVISGILLPVRGIVAMTVATALMPLVIRNYTAAEFFDIGPAIGVSVTLGILVSITSGIRSLIERERLAELRTVNNELDGLRVTLEKRVAERTRDLNIASQVARQITQMLGLEQLLTELVEQTRVGFDLYFVSVFLYAPESQMLEIAAGTGEAGERLRTAGNSFHITATPSLVAQAGRELRSVMVNDVSQSEAHYSNPSLPNTQSETALPMVVGGELIGVLDLQSEYKNRFGEADIAILTTLAEQIAIAIQNARLYEKQVETAAELRRADRVKSKFLANITHELRTPLNAMLNLTQMVAEEMMGPVNAEQKTFLNQSVASSQHLLQLINDVLDISKIQAGKLNLYIEEDIDLLPELEIVMGMVQSLLSGREGGESVQLIRKIDASLPHVRGDRRRIRQVLINLLANAVKFTEQGTITLSAWCEEGAGGAM